MRISDWSSDVCSSDLKPRLKLREDCEEQVSTRSPRPDRPASVSGRAPRATPNRDISAKPRLISAARAFWPRPRPSTTPQAIASTFLTAPRSEEHTSELQSLMRISYAVFCLKKKKNTPTNATSIIDNTIL